MEVLIMFVVIAIGFAWAMPQEEIVELDKRLNKKEIKQSGGGIGQTQPLQWSNRNYRFESCPDY